MANPGNTFASAVKPVGAINGPTPIAAPKAPGQPKPLPGPNPPAMQPPAQLKPNVGWNPNVQIAPNYATSPTTGQWLGGLRSILNRPQQVRTASDHGLFRMMDILNHLAMRPIPNSIKQALGFYS